MNDPHIFTPLMRKFLEWMKVTNRSPRTLVSTEHALGCFIRWAEDRGLAKPTEVTKQVIERYQRYLFHYRKRNGDPLGVGTQYTRLVPIRTWFKWLSRNNWILYNPASELEFRRTARRLPKHVLTASEAEQVIAQATNARDRAILETFYSTGIRRMELINLKVYDVDAERGTVMVQQGKRGKDRMVPIGERALAWIDQYRREVRPALVLDGTATLFLNDMGRQFTPTGLSRLVKGYVDASEVNKHGSCHLFRHTMATLMLENGADIRYIQAMLGHSSLETTTIYTQVSIRKLKEIHTATHPAKGRPAG